MPDKRSLMWALFAVLAVNTTWPSVAGAQCPSSVQARVQLNNQDPWKQSTTINLGQSFNVAAFQNGWDVLASCCTAFTVTKPNGAVIATSNPGTVTGDLGGLYNVRATCGGIVGTASVNVAAGATYDMLDYMWHDDQNLANVLLVNGGPAEELFRDYADGPGHFYISKNQEMIFGFARGTQYEEFLYDSNFIYLVRDTSWQPSNWCAGIDTSFELWANGINRGQWLPRKVVDGARYTMGPYEIRARHDGTDCAVCDSPTDSAGVANQTRTVQVRHWAEAPFNSSLADIIEIAVVGGSGGGSNEHYYFSRTLGWVGYSDSMQSSYFSKGAAGGGSFPIRIHDRCPIKNSDMETNTTAEFGHINFFAPNGGWAFHANFPRQGNAGLGLRFGFYSAGGTETLSQVLAMRFEPSRKYTFSSFMQGGADNLGTLPYEIGYANVDGNRDTFVPLAKRLITVGGGWANTSGVSYTAPASGLPIGKQIVVRFGTGGSTDVWFDNLRLLVECPIGTCP